MPSSTLAKTVLAGLLIYSCNVAAKKIYVGVDAEIFDVYDPNGVVSDLHPGDTISGLYAYETDTPDQEPMIGIGVYQHEVGAGTIELTSGAYTFKTTTNSPSSTSIIIHIEDEAWTPGVESYQVYSSDNAYTNGVNIDHISIDLNSTSGGDLLNSEALTDTPPNPALFTIRDVFISGSRNGNPFSIIAHINSLGTDQPSPLEIVPGTALLHPEQRFDALFNLHNSTPIADITGTLNGMDISPYLQSCRQSSPQEGVQSFLCPDTHWLLEPGDNQLHLQVDLMDNTSISNDVTWSRPY